MANNENCWAVVPAAGVGTRMQSAIPKQYLQLRDRTVIEHTLERLGRHPRIRGVVVVVAAEDDIWPSVSQRLPIQVQAAPGGSERWESVANGLAYLAMMAEADDWVLVHDAARPCLRADDIDKLIDRSVETQRGGILAVPVRDTLKRCADNGAIETTVDRTALWHALTPQMFPLQALRDALAVVAESGEMVTDEAQAMERAGHQTQVVEGHVDNIKITHPADLELAAMYLAEQERKTS